MFGRGLSTFFSYGIFIPLAWIGRGAFRLFFVPAYRRYIKMKQRIKNNPHFAGIVSFQHFLERYALHATLIALGILVASNNIFARTIRPDEVGQGAVWTALAQSETSELIVETGLTKPIVNASSTSAIGGPPPAVAENVEQVPIVDATSTGVSEADSAVGAVHQAAAPDRDVEQYVVQGGDTISTIAEQFEISSRTILWANGLGETDYIKPGQSLKIPPVSGYLYAVKSGDTVASIVKKYGGTEEDILEANSLPLAEALQVGQEIIIPGGQPPAPPAPVFTPGRTLIERVFVGNVPPPSSAGGRGKFLWPTTNRKINQYYRGRWHTGLDIEGTYSSPIYAAAAGRVTFASRDRSGYGLHIIIDNGGGFTTLYAHASKVFVRPGQQVTRGQTIAMVGSTGRSTGTHLHFEIRLGGGPANPLAYY